MNKPSSVRPIPRRPKSAFTKLLIAAPFFLALAAVFGYFNAQRGADPNRDNTHSAAIVACENAVAENLKAPKSAQFSATATGGGPWVVAGTVDAQNSFGALVRTAFGCSVTIKDGVAKTTIEYLG